MKKTLTNRGEVMTILEELLEAAEHLGITKYRLERVESSFIFENTSKEKEEYNKAKSNFIRVLDKYTEQSVYEAAAERSEMVENLSSRGEV